MTRKKFKLYHSVMGMTALVAAEALALHFFKIETLQIGLVLFVSIAGSCVNLYVSTEVIEEVPTAWRMLWVLSAVVTEFVLFFAFQYLFLLHIQPASFPTLSPDATSLLLHSVMIFVFNPLYVPATSAGRALLLVNSLSAIALVLFLLQNIGQFRKR